MVDGWPWVVQLGAWIENVKLLNKTNPKKPSETTQTKLRPFACDFVWKMVLSAAHLPTKHSTDFT